MQLSPSKLTQVAMTMQERLVTEAIAKRLKCEGVLSLQVRCGREHGPDIEAQLPSSRRRLFIEAKGDVKAPDLAIGVALYQILARYDGQAVSGMALPFSRKYQKLVINACACTLSLSRMQKCGTCPRTQAGFSPQNLRPLWRL